jgi:hypothetical protein
MLRQAAPPASSPVLGEKVKGERSSPIELRAAAYTAATTTEMGSRMCNSTDAVPRSAEYTGITETTRGHTKEEHTMVKLTLRYTRYILASLASVGFGMALN